MSELIAAAYLWGGNREMAMEELRSILLAYDRQSRVIGERERTVEFFASETAVRKVNERAAYVKHAGFVVGRADREFNEVTLELRDVPLKGFKVIDYTGLGVEARLGDLIRISYHGKVDLENPNTLILVLPYGEASLIVAAGLSPEKGFWERKKGREYFEISALVPQMARFMVNLAMTKEGELFLDPFAGSMSIPLEAVAVGAYAVGGDIDLEALSGGQKNMKKFFGKGWDVVAADALKPPLRDGVFSALATDPPFGRLKKVLTTHESYLEFLGAFVERSGRLLRPGGGIAFLMPQGVNLEDLPWKEAGISVAGLVKLRAHKSFTRYAVRGVKVERKRKR